jgi:hypothetical protein
VDESAREAGRVGRVEESCFWAGDVRADDFFGGAPTSPKN